MCQNKANFWLRKTTCIDDSLTIMVYYFANMYLPYRFNHVFTVFCYSCIPTDSGLILKHILKSSSAQLFPWDYRHVPK